MTPELNFVQVTNIFWIKYKLTLIFTSGHLKGGRDACQGDSGGPLVCVNDQNEPILYGAVS